MIIKNKDQRVAVLIDVQNLYHSAKNIYGARVNFKEVLKTAVSGRYLIHAWAYVIKTESGEENKIDGISWVNIRRQNRKEQNKEKILGMFETKNEITNDDVENSLGASDAAATNYLEELEQDGKIEQVGKTGRGVFYRLKNG